METKRVRDRLKRKHPRSDEMLGNVQRWSAPGEAPGGSSERVKNLEPASMEARREDN